MNKVVTTLAQARKQTYGGHAGFHRAPDREGRCVQEVVSYKGNRFGFYFQCHRKPHFGPGNLYCRVHDPAAVKARAEKRQKNFDRKMDYERVKLYAHPILKLLRETVTTVRPDGDSPADKAWRKRRDELLAQLA